MNQREKKSLGLINMAVWFFTPLGSVGLWVVTRNYHVPIALTLAMWIVYLPLFFYWKKNKHYLLVWLLVPSTLALVFPCCVFICFGFIVCNFLSLNSHVLLFWFLLVSLYLLYFVLLLREYHDCFLKKKPVKWQKSFSFCDGTYNMQENSFLNNDVFANHVGKSILWRITMIFILLMVPFGGKYAAMTTKKISLPLHYLVATIAAGIVPIIFLGVLSNGVYGAWVTYRLERKHHIRFKIIEE